MNPSELAGLLVTSGWPAMVLVLLIVFLISPNSVYKKKVCPANNMFAYSSYFGSCLFECSSYIMHFQLTDFLILISQAGDPNYLS